MNIKINKKTQAQLKAAKACHSMDELSKYLGFTPDEEASQFQAPLKSIVEERIEFLKLPPEVRG